MPTQIKQTRDNERAVTVLRVEGEMGLNDALVLEKITLSVREETGDRVIVDLADLDLLDSEAASVLRRVSGRDGFEIEGIEIFLQAMVDDAERRAP